jgi:hypothetical protein
MCPASSKADARGVISHGNPRQPRSVGVPCVPCVRRSCGQQLPPQPPHDLIRTHDVLRAALVAPWRARRCTVQRGGALARVVVQRTPSTAARPQPRPARRGTAPGRRAGAARQAARARRAPRRAPRCSRAAQHMTASARGKLTPRVASARQAPQLYLPARSAPAAQRHARARLGSWGAAGRVGVWPGAALTMRRFSRQNERAWRCPPRRASSQSHSLRMCQEQQQR